MRARSQRSVSHPQEVWLDHGQAISCRRAWASSCLSASFSWSSRRCWRASFSCSGIGLAAPLVCVSAIFFPLQRFVFFHDGFIHASPYLLSEFRRVHLTVDGAP